MRPLHWELERKILLYIILNKKSVLLVLVLQKSVGRFQRDGRHSRWEESASYESET